MTEQQLAEKIIEYLSPDYEIYPEVVDSFRRRADIVGVLDTGKIKLAHIIECKTSFSLKLIDQILH